MMPPPEKRKASDIASQMQPKRLSMGDTPVSPTASSLRFSIVVTTQSVESPDYNTNDLSFFNSLQSDVRIQSMSNRRDNVAAVIQAYAEYFAYRMTLCWLSLITSFKGTLETGGNNNYKSHRGVAKKWCSGIEDLVIPKAVVDHAALTLARLEQDEASGLHWDALASLAAADSGSEVRRLTQDRPNQEQGCAPRKLLGRLRYKNRADVNTGNRLTCRYGETPRLSIRGNASSS